MIAAIGVAVKGDVRIYFGATRHAEKSTLLFVDGEGVAGASDFPDLLYSIASAMARSADQHRHLFANGPGTSSTCR
jgi:hypothetical protein